MIEKIKLVSVVGPTASGKTKLAVELANVFGGEIVSADSMQIYQGMRIATAKPTEDEKQGIPHHLMGFLPPEENYSVARFVEDAKRAITDIASRGKLPILVGGTGLYADAVLSGMQFEEEPGDPAIRERLYQRLETEGADVLYAELLTLDPEAAEKILIYIMIPADRVNTVFCMQTAQGIRVFLRIFQAIVVACEYVACNNNNVRIASVRDLYHFFCSFYIRIDTEMEISQQHNFRFFPFMRLYIIRASLFFAPFIVV